MQDVGTEGYSVFQWRECDDTDRVGSTMWAIFPDGTDCYTPGNVPYMVNYRVDDLDAVLSALREEGVWVDDRIQEEECGRFGWAMDADCRRIELWQLCGE